MKWKVSPGLLTSVKPVDWQGLFSGSYLSWPLFDDLYRSPLGTVSQTLVPISLSSQPPDSPLHGCWWPTSKQIQKMGWNSLWRTYVTCVPSFSPVSIPTVGHLITSSVRQCWHSFPVCPPLSNTTLVLRLPLPIYSSTLINTVRGWFYF